MGNSNSVNHNSPFRFSDLPQELVERVEGFIVNPVDRVHFLSTCRTLWMRRPKTSPQIVFFIVAEQMQEHLDEDPDDAWKLLHWYIRSYEPARTMQRIIDRDQERYPITNPGARDSRHALVLYALVHAHQGMFYLLQTLGLVSSSPEVHRIYLDTVIDRSRFDIIAAITVREFDMTVTPENMVRANERSNIFRPGSLTWNTLYWESLSPFMRRVVVTEIVDSYSDKRGRV
ncbi:hypothetical protein M426DRAFT_260302 [Hypoxylon sp. CI-4A]|nr:hypothetical protein M426DRAFT_260302 [Hypoxylon sp. CI-4A]